MGFLDDLGDELYRAAVRRQERRIRLMRWLIAMAAAFVIGVLGWAVIDLRSDVADLREGDSVTIEQAEVIQALISRQVDALTVRMDCLVRLVNDPPDDRGSALGLAAARC